MEIPIFIGPIIQQNDNASPVHAVIVDGHRLSELLNNRRGTQRPCHSCLNVNNAMLTVFSGTMKLLFLSERLFTKIIKHSCYDCGIQLIDQFFKKIVEARYALATMPQRCNRKSDRFCRGVEIPFFSFYNRGIYFPH